jgi:hypothetical protein
MYDSELSATYVVGSHAVLISTAATADEDTSLLEACEYTARQECVTQSNYAPATLAPWLSCWAPRQQHGLERCTVEALEAHSAADHVVARHPHHLELDHLQAPGNKCGCKWR